MREKRFKMLRNLLIYFLILGLAFNFPATRVFADGDEERVVTGMSLSWPEGEVHSVVEEPTGYYDKNEILEGSILTVTYSDQSSTNYVYHDYEFYNADKDEYFYFTDYGINTDEVDWVVGAEGAHIYIYYCDYDHDYAEYYAYGAITIIPDPSIISWADAKAAAKEIKTELSLAKDDAVTFLYSESYYTKKQKGNLFYVDVPAKKKAAIQFTGYVEYSVFKDGGNSPEYLYSNGDTTVILTNLSSASEKYYISEMPSYEDQVTATLTLENVPVFDDVKDGALTLKEGKNTDLDSAPELEWYSGSLTSPYKYSLAKVVIPAGKSVSFDSCETESGWWIPDSYVFGDDGVIDNYYYTLKFNNSIVYLDNIQGKRIVNSGSSQVEYYFIINDGVESVTLSYHDYPGAVTAMVYPNFPDELEVDEDYKKPREYELDGDNSYINLDNYLFNGQGKYVIIGWKDMDSEDEYPEKYLFYPSENRSYNLEAEWQERPFSMVTFHSNYDTSWGMAEATITEKIYEGFDTDVTEKSNKIERKDGYKIDKWYYLENDKKNYVDNWFEPKGDTDLYAEWVETDEVKVTVHSNYPEEFERDEIVYTDYVSPGEYYSKSYSFDCPDNYQLAGWTDQDGKEYDYIGMTISKKTDLYAKWKRIYKVTFHSNYPEVLGKENETDVEYDWGDGVVLDWRFDADEYQATVYITGWSKTVGGESIGEMRSRIYPEEDTDLYAIWEVPELKTYRFHSMYPSEWKMVDKTVELSTNLNGEIEGFKTLDTQIPGKDGATIVGWEDEDGFRVYDPGEFIGHVWFSNTDFFAVWSTRPTVTINTNLPEKYTGMTSDQIKYFTDRTYSFNPYEFGVVNSIFDYNCKLVNKATDESFVIGEYVGKIKLSESAVFDAVWKPTKHITVNSCYSDGSPYQYIRKEQWDGGFVLPNQIYTDSETGIEYETSYYTDGVNKYYPEIEYDIPNETILDGVFREMGSHNWDKGKVTKQPTCTEKGIRVYTCTDPGCGETYSEDILPEGHKEVNVSRLEPTYTEKGHTSGKKCSVCEEILEGVEEIPYLEGFDKDADGKTYYYKDGKKQLDFTGFVKNVSGVWFVEKGVLNTAHEDIVKNPADKNWYYISGGKQNLAFTGFAANKNGTFYCKNGVVQFITSIVKHQSNGNWYYINNGKQDLSFTGFEKNANGTYYCKNGVVQFITSIVKHQSNGNWYYINKGKQDLSFTGFEKNANGTYYCKNGVVQFITSIVKHQSNGNWYYINKGKQDLSFTGFASNDNGTYYCQNGIVKFITSIVKHQSNGNWYYINNGKFDKSFTGFASNANGTFYCKNGVVQFITSIEKHQSNGKWYYIKNGKQDLTFTGIAKNSKGSFLVQKGIVNFNYNGKYKYNGKTYTIKNGKVI